MMWLLSLLYSHSPERPLIVPASANLRDDAKADIHARGSWGRQQSAFFDIRVFHPNAPGYRQTQVGSLFCRHELEKNVSMETVLIV